MTYRLIQVGLEAEIAIGDNANDLTTLINNRQTGNAVTLGQIEDITYHHGLVNRDRILQDPGFISFDFGDLGCLLRRGQVLVDDANTTLLSQRDGQTPFGHRIHGSR